jgi:Asp-tRNA(Asn)/Glu-tRNA(Gln) amidotransferase A subunit family amidase
VRPYVSQTSAFKDGSDSPRAFLERCLKVIAAQEDGVGAFVTLNIEGARAAADASTARWKAGATFSPIDGMPVGIKDIMETADMATEQGSPLFVGWHGKRDCAAVAALHEAGAVVLGKTVTTEFASLHPSTTRNPWDHARTPGGSSSGSAAAVGIGMIPAALGSQVIGSIIRPASFCGCVGFKPSVGGINRGGSFDHFSQSCTGVLGATLADTWTVARAMSLRIGGDPGYPGLSGPIELPAARQPRRIASPSWKQRVGQKRPRRPNRHWPMLAIACRRQVSRSSTGHRTMPPPRSKRPSPGRANCPCRSMSGKGTGRSTRMPPIWTVADSAPAHSAVLLRRRT